MSLLDTHSDSLEISATTPRPEVAPPAKGWSLGADIKGAGSYFMRSMAELGRSASMALGAVPVMVDKVVGKDNLSGRSLADQYFEAHDRVFGKAVDYWTPKPGEVSTAAQVIGQFSGGMVQFLANPAIAVANAQLSTAEDLVRQGVDPGAALVAGDIAGVSMAAGIRIPAAIGSTLVQRVASGAAGNVLQSAVTAGAQQQVLKAAGAATEVVDQFNPLDLKGRTVDALLGAVFGAKAHMDAGRPTVEMTQTQKDALLLLNQARHLEESSSPGRPATPADLTASVEATRTAIDQMLKGEPVAVPEAAPKFDADAVREAERVEIAKVVAEHAQTDTPIERPRMAEPVAQEATADASTPGGKPQADATAAPEVPKFDEAVRIPTGDFDPATGDPRSVSANDFIAKAQADAADAKATAKNLFTTAAECLLGSL